MLSLFKSSEERNFLCGFKFRDIEWFVLKGTFKGHIVQPPCIEQGHLPLDQVAQSPIQLDFECFQGWGIYHRITESQNVQDWKGPLWVI